MEHEQELMIFREITYLISLEQEGAYWDFKKQWYTDKSDMLHDIICMSNNLCNRTAYIIIGIDEEQGYSVVDVSTDLNRKNTQKVVDFLKDKKFAGGVRPVVYVESFSYHSGKIDAIVIEKSCNTPFYLTTQYEKVRANNIYTRVMDTNTPIDGSADINHVEQLWRKRFHLDDTPLEKFNYYLKRPDDWKTIQGSDIGYFYKYSPEYTIICEADESAAGYEYYMLDQIDSSPSWWIITLKYHHTAIEQFRGIALDGGRCFSVAPQRAGDFMSIGVSRFGFLIQNDLRFRLLEFYHRKETTEEYSYTNYLKTLVVFQSEQEYTSFSDYLQTHGEEYRIRCSNFERTELPCFPNLPNYYIEELEKNYRDALVIQQMLNAFRNHE